MKSVETVQVSEGPFTFYSILKKKTEDELNDEGNELPKYIQIYQRLCLISFYFIQFLTLKQFIFIIYILNISFFYKKRNTYYLKKRFMAKKMLSIKK